MRVLAAATAAIVVICAFLVYEEPSEQRIPARNWEGAVSLAEVDSVTVRSPSTETEVVQVVTAAARAGKKVKVVGSGHSWARIAAPPPGSVLLSTHRLNQPLRHDAERKQATVQGGMRLRDLADYMAALDPPLALHNYPSVDEQTVAGSIATATHGSGADHVNLAAVVRRLRFVNASGAVVEASTTRNRDVFSAAAVSLGALGVVTEVTLQCVPLYRLRVRQRPVPDEELVQNWERHMRSGEFVKFWWLPHTGYTTVFSSNRTDEQEDMDPVPRPVGVAFSRLVGGLHALSSWVPALTAPFNVLLGFAGFQERERVARWDQGLIIPFPVPPHAELEYSVPLHKGLHFFLSIVDLVRERGWRLNQVVEVRFVAGDDLWLSTDHGGPRCHITILLPSERGSEEIRSIFAAVEEAAIPMGGRPHWAKSFYAPRTAVAAMFPHWRDWHRVRCRMDPGGMFSNDYLDSFIGTAQDSCQE